MQEQITAALKKLGASAPKAIAKELGEPVHKVGYHLRAMVEGKSAKAAGIGRSRIYALPDQKLEQSEGTPPPAQAEAREGAAQSCRADRRKAAGARIHPGHRRRQQAHRGGARRPAHLHRSADPAHRDPAPQSLRGLT